MPLKHRKMTAVWHSDSSQACRPSHGFLSSLFNTTHYRLQDTLHRHHALLLWNIVTQNQTWESAPNLQRSNLIPLSVSDMGTGWTWGTETWEPTCVAWGITNTCFAKCEATENFWKHRTIASVSSFSERIFPFLECSSMPKRTHFCQNLRFSLIFYQIHGLHVD